MCSSDLFAWTCAGSYLSLIDSDGQVRSGPVHDCQEWKRFGAFRVPEAAHCQLAWSRKNDKLALASDKHLYIFRATTKLFFEAKGRAKISHLKWAPGGETLAWTASDRSLSVIHLPTRAVTSDTFSSHVIDCMWAPHGAALAVVLHNNKTYVLSADSLLRGTFVPRELVGDRLQPARLAWTKSGSAALTVDCYSEGRGRIMKHQVVTCDTSKRAVGA